MDHTDSSLSPSPNRDLFPLRHKFGYLFVVASVVGLFLWASLAFVAELDRYQYDKERYAAERALDAIANNNEDLARQEVNVLMTDRPIYSGFLNRPISDVYEGPVLRNRVTPLEQLAAKLLDLELFEESEMVLWKALFEYHIASRTLELIVPWELMYSVKALRDQREDWASVFEICKILAIHGVDTIRNPNEMEPTPFEVYPTLFESLPHDETAQIMTGLRNLYDSRLETRPNQRQSLRRRALVNLVQARQLTRNDVTRRKLNAMIHGLHIDLGEREQAREFLGEVWGRDAGFMDLFWNNFPWPTGRETMDLLEREPSLLGMLWRDRPATATLSLTNFLDSFLLDERVHVYRFQGRTELKLEQNGYFNPNNRFMHIGDSVELNMNVAASMEISSYAPIRRVYLAYKSTYALGLFPILLISVDDGPYIPIYCDSTEPDLVAIDLGGVKGTFKLNFVYLNDAAFQWPDKNINEDRNLTLYRIALVHVEPAG